MIQVITCSWFAIDLFRFACFECNVLVSWCAWVSCFSIEKSSSPIGETSNFVELECVGDETTLLFDDHTPIKIEWVKTFVCQESYHMKLMSTYAIVLEPMSTFVFWFFYHYELFNTCKKNWRLCFMLQAQIWWSNEFVCVSVYAICKCVNKCTHVKCECAKH